MFLYILGLMELCIPFDLKYRIMNVASLKELLFNSRLMLYFSLYAIHTSLCVLHSLVVVLTN